jgi:hypothetical protein
MTTTAPSFRTPPTDAPHRMRSPALLAAAAIAITLLVIVVAVADLTHDGSTVGSGVSASQARTLPPFSAVDLAGTNEMTVQVGTRQRVVVRADSNLLAKVITDVRSGVLVVADHGSFTARRPMSVLVTVPSLRAVTLSGTGYLTVHGVRTTAFTVRLSGDGAVTVSGTADRVDASITGTGYLDLASLIARDAAIDIQGTATATVDASRSLDATIVGTGSIIYGGHPAQVTKKITGSGLITGR